MNRTKCAAIFLGVLAVLVAAPASAATRVGRQGPAAHPTVVWTDITLASRDKRPELERFLKQIIEHTTRRADWGHARQSPLEARFDVTEFSAVAGKDVVRVTCTGVGKLKGGQSVRSHFSMGGRPTGRGELERQLLTMLGRGIVNRLAEVARASAGARPAAN